MSENKPIDDEDLEDIKETLKRCPEGTFEALIDFRTTGNRESLHNFLVGVLKRHVEPEYVGLLDNEHLALSFADDLGIDSMTMMEVVMMVEECLGIHIENEQLMEIETYGELDKYIAENL
ncbi:MAG: phosphopantetheine-binding protein [Verrucomicrobiales bacterium]|nr:phosphopantetheine-binding protein [Verrucomicrobiales bacterium]